MIYQMKQKFFAIGDKFVIRDAEGREAFTVDGQVFSLGHKLSFRDADGNELAFIKQKLLAWGPTFEIWQGDRLQAVVKKALFSLFRQRFFVDVEGPDDLVAEGNFWDYEYTFLRQDRQVAVVSRRWFTLTDTYGIEVAEGEDALLILATAVVIDLVHDDARRRDA